MRRNNFKNFILQRQFIITLTVVVATAALMTGVYMSGRNENPQGEKTAEITETETERSEAASTVIKPKEKTPEVPEVVEEAPATAAIETEKSAEEEPTEEIKEEEKTVETSAKVKTGQTANLHFSEESDLLWPLNGSVLMSYNMDQTVYFATLQQYKYNPAVIIGGNVNDAVVCAANGIITEIKQDAETGCTVVMDLGDGYSASYGQLQNLPFAEGAFVSAGQTIGYVADPTKYYSVEGSNLYFKLEKDNTPVDPVLYFE